MKVEISNGELIDKITILEIKLIEIEDEVELCFDTANYLPKDFNALKGMNDLDWASIELIEIEKELRHNLIKKSTIQ